MSRGNRIERSLNKKLKKAGKPVTLYLDGETAHLYDLARLDPTITVSHLFCSALQAALGDEAQKHPMELMLEQNKAEVEEIEEMLENARGRVASTEKRLPLELARVEWLSNLLGTEGLVRLRNLRTFLFYDATCTIQPQPDSARDGLLEYGELLRRYEYTKATDVDSQFACHSFWEGLPERLEIPSSCCWEDGCIQTTGQDISCDLNWRCEEHHTSRWQQKKGWDPITRKKLIGEAHRMATRPHWEIEELSSAQIAMMTVRAKGTLQISAETGYISHERKAFTTIRSSAITAMAIDLWERQNSTDAAILAELDATRDGVNERDEAGNPALTWAGMPTGNNSLRKTMLYKMTSEQLASYKENCNHRISLMEFRGEFIRAIRTDWNEAGQPWPFDTLETWNDEELSQEIASDVNELYPAFGKDKTMTCSRIKGDLTLIKFAEANV